MTRPRRAVVLRALGLGDALTAVPALRGLRRGLGDGWRIELAAPASLAPLVLSSGAVDAVVDTEPFALGPLTDVGPRPDLAVNLHGRGPQSTARLRALEPRWLVAFGVDAEWRGDEHEVARWCRLVRAAGIAPDADPADLLLPAPPAPDGAAGCVVVHPGAASAARRWPADRFAAVARALAGFGQRVVVTGGGAERDLAARVAAGAGLPDDAVLAGRTSLVELAGVVAAASLVVCGDTGVAHLATAYATPSVVLFGPVAPALWGPPSRPEHRALWTGRTGDPHGDAPDPGLLEIAVDDVLAAAAGIREAPVEPVRRSTGSSAHQ